MKLQPSVPVSRLSVNSRRTVKFPGTARETGAEGAPRRTLQHFPVYQAPKRQSAAVRMKSIQNGAFIRNAPSIGPSAQPMFVPIRMRLKMRGRSAGVEISLRKASEPIWKKVPIPALTVSAAAKSQNGAWKKAMPASSRNIAARAVWPNCIMNCRPIRSVRYPASSGETMIEPPISGKISPTVAIG